MKQILDKSNMTEQDWQNYRRTQKGIGGSDCAVILGLSKYKSAFTLWLEKTGQIEAPDVNNQYVEWGNILEPVIREKFRRETGFQIFENPYVLQHDEHSFMIANIDGEVIDAQGERGVLEIKTASERMRPDWEEGPPYAYMLQVQHYLAVTDYNFAYVAVLIGGNHFDYFRVERDDYIIDKIVTAEMEFIQMVESRTPPEITGHPSEMDWLAKTFPEANDEIGELSKESYGLVLRYSEIQKQIKRLEEEADYIKSRLKLEAKESKGLKNDLITVSMPTIKKINFNSKQFAIDYPELFEQYKNKEVSYRGFAVKINNKGR